MPRTADPNKKNASGVYESQKEASRNYEKNNVDKIVLRIPKGSRELIKAHQELMKSKYPDNPKYQSVNLMITSLLETEVGKKFNC